MNPAVPAAVPVTTLPVRPLLFPALTALTGNQEWAAPPAKLSITEAGVTTPRGEFKWAVETPREGLELLAARDLLPMEWVEDTRRNFLCHECEGSGHFREGPCPACPRPARNGAAGSNTEVGTGHVAHPPTMAGLVAWASLGPAAIARIEELVGATMVCCRAAMPATTNGWEPGVFWTFGPRTGKIVLMASSVSASGPYNILTGNGYLNGTLRTPAADIWAAGLSLWEYSPQGMAIRMPLL